MTLLELISTAAAATTTTTTTTHPITFNPDLILPNLKPENPNNGFNLVEPLNGFQISDSNSAVLNSNSTFFKKLKRRLNSKGSDSLTSTGFSDMLNHFLEEIGSRIVINNDDRGKLFSESYWNFVSRDVVALVIEACLSLGIWGVLETLISGNLVAQGLQSELLSKLIGRSRCDLVCLCIKRFSDGLNWSDLLGVLKYLLLPSKEARVNMASIRKEWEDQALLAVKKTGDKDLAEKKRVVAKEAAILLMVAYDGFTAPELCLHYLLSSTKVDDMVFSGAISKLNVDEILGLIRYLGKWLRKYERFPEAIPCPEAALSGPGLGLVACQWVPTVEAVAEALGVVIDEWFSSLVLHSEFHQELKSVEGVMSSLVVEGRLCGTVTSLIQISRSEAIAL